VTLRERPEADGRDPELYVLSPKRYHGLLQMYPNPDRPGGGSDKALRLLPRSVSRRLKQFSVILVLCTWVEFSACATTLAFPFSPDC
jgi:hypothetical protein